MPAPKDALSAREAAFVREYLALRNQTKAYIAAGYAPKAAATNAARLIRKDQVQKAIEEGEAKLRAKMAPTVDKIIQHYSLMAFSGMSRFVRIDDDGQPIIDLSACTPADLDNLHEITTESYDEKDPEHLDGEGKPTTRTVKRVKIKLYDRRTALEKLGQHLGMFKGTKEEVADALQELLEEIQERGSAIPVKPQGPLGAAKKSWKQ